MQWGYEGIYFNGFPNCVWQPTTGDIWLVPYCDSLPLKCIWETKIFVLFSSASWKLNFAPYFQVRVRNQIWRHIFKCMSETKFCAIFSSACQKPNLAFYFQAHCKNQILHHISLASQKPNLCHIFKCILEIKLCVIFSSASWKQTFASYLKAHLKNQCLRHIFELMETKCCLNVVALASD